MKKIFCVLVSLHFFIITMSNAEEVKVKPIDIVNQRMLAHNSHDIVAFLSVYSDDFQVYDYPEMPLGKPGKDHLKSIFEPLFRENSVSTEIHHQIEQGRYVINHETVTNRGKISKYVSIYEVQDGLIKSVRFITEY